MSATRAMLAALCAAAVAACGPKTAPPPPAPPVVPTTVVEPPPPPPPPPREPTSLANVLRIEAERDESAIEDLVVTAVRGVDRDTREAAVRALGRIGGARAIAALRTLWIEHEKTRPLVADAAAIAGATELSPDLVSFFFRGATKDQALILARALGRMGDEDSQRALAYGAGAPDAVLRAESLLALGNHGQRKLAVSEKAVAQIVDGLDDADVAVKYAATYALFKLPGDAPPAGAIEPLVANVGDPDPDVRAMAIRALARWQPERTLPFVEARLDDADWRVRVEAVRALTTDKSDAETRAALVRWVAKQKPEALGGPSVHALIEALSRLRKHADEKSVKAAADAWVKQKLQASPPIARDTVHCLATAIRVRAGRRIGDLDACGDPSGSGWPAFKRRELAAQLLGEGAGGDAVARILALRKLAGDEDPRVRAAAIVALVGIDDPVARLRAVAAIEDADLMVVGSALEAMAGKEVFYAAAGERALERAKQADLSSPDVVLTFLEFFAKAKPAGARDLVAPLRAHPNRTVRAKAREVVAAIDGRDAGETAASSKNPLPPGDAEDVSDEIVRWQVATTRGTFEIELDSTVAPWTVAALTALAEKGTYDGTLWHRVVPDFVVQGGDPTGSGWGGPGFTLPAEPSLSPYTRGAVGVADAGLDTGGSQWFVTHTRAPHLEARYTWFGRVVAGQDVVDNLLVGDRIEKVTVTITQRPGEPDGLIDL